MKNQKFFVCDSCAAVVMEESVDNHSGWHIDHQDYSPNFSTYFWMRIMTAEC